MTDVEIEKRLEILEAEVAWLKSKAEKKTTKPKFPGGNKGWVFLQIILHMKKQCVLGVNIVNRKKWFMIRTKIDDNSRHRLP